ncbi:S24 family peptidase [Bacteroides faecis]|jgi:hypothetical protein|uniref:S24 family peptidase n=1 Tax=Bacteroides faecis TaxID=674529 RepID=UPI000D64B46A|nr:LexA family transcriptional regulator [Bacteroides faecis]MCB6634926.1 hypothetical protein [Bacteroides faecis]MCE8941615.1 hypothetical protein [Bacteroides faecis]UYU56587.1 hypothetical protein KQP61_20895 [Bacteroides faecis]
MGLRERLLDYIAYKGIDKATLERKSGLSNDAVNKMGDNTRVSTLDRISNAYPDINIAWLKTGVGEMILGNEENKRIPHYDGLKGKAIPHIDVVTASCGLPNGFNSAITKGDCERYIIPDMPGCDFTIRAGGRSMINRNVPERSINDRDIVGCRIVTTRSHVRWGEVYALATYDGIMIKKVEESEQEGYIRCVPFNKEEGFKPYDVPVNEIHDWALVVGVVSVKTWI